MPRVEVNVDSGLDLPIGWAEEAERFSQLIIDHPGISALEIKSVSLKREVVVTHKPVSEKPE